jgi:hypothetical protein
MPKTPPKSRSRANETRIRRQSRSKSNALIQQKLFNNCSENFKIDIKRMDQKALHGEGQNQTQVSIQSEQHEKKRRDDKKDKDQKSGAKAC